MKIQFAIVSHTAAMPIKWSSSIYSRKHSSILPTNDNVCSLPTRPLWSIIAILFSTIILLQCASLAVAIGRNGEYLSNSFQSKSNDGASTSETLNVEENSISSTTSTTSVTDIRKLLEDYVRYLESLPEIDRSTPTTTTTATINDNQYRQQHREQNQHQPALEIISTAESKKQFLQPQIAMAPMDNSDNVQLTDKGQLQQPNTNLDTIPYDILSNDYLPPIINLGEPYQKPPLDTETETSTSSSEVEDGAYDAYTIEPGIRLNLNNERLHSFIENVLVSMENADNNVSGEVDDNSNDDNSAEMTEYENNFHLNNNEMANRHNGTTTSVTVTKSSRTTLAPSIFEFMHQNNHHHYQNKNGSMFFTINTNDNNKNHTKIEMINGKMVQVNDDDRRHNHEHHQPSTFNKTNVDHQSIVIMKNSRKRKEPIVKMGKNADSTTTPSSTTTQSITTLSSTITTTMPTITTTIDNGIVVGDDNDDNNDNNVKGLSMLNDTIDNNYTDVVAAADSATDALMNGGGQADAINESSSTTRTTVLQFNGIHNLTELAKNALAAAAQAQAEAQAQVEETLSGPTTIPTIIEDRIDTMINDFVQNNDKNVNRNNKEINSNEKKDQTLSNTNGIDQKTDNQQYSLELANQARIDSDDLLKQLRRTKELLSIQIENLKTLEQTVFGRSRSSANKLPVNLANNTVNSIEYSKTLTNSANVSQIGNRESLLEHEDDNAVIGDSIEGEFVNEKTDSSVTGENSRKKQVERKLHSETNKPNVENLAFNGNNNNNKFNSLNDAAQIEWKKKDGQHDLIKASSGQLINQQNNNRKASTIIRPNYLAENTNNGNGKSNDNKRLITSTTEPKGNENESLLKKLSNIDNQTNLNIASGRMNNENYGNNRNIGENTSTLTGRSLTGERSNSHLILLTDSNGTSIDTVNDESTLITNDNNGNNDNDNRNESNIETMILTHVPKITIIHKIMKPLNNGRKNHFNHQNTNGNAANNNNNDNNNGINNQLNEQIQNDTDEKGNKSNENGNEDLFDESNLYKEALRKHQDLIRSTMSSMSLYPAAFKRYKINSNNKVNNVGEIYLLPNFFQPNTDGLNSNSSGLATAASSSNRAAITEPTMMIQPIVRQHLSPEENLTLEWNPLTQTFVNMFNGQLENSLLNDNENQLMEHLFNNPNENVNNNHHLNTPNIFELELNSLNDNRNRRRLAKPKLLLNHHTILSVNQNPENILKLYRPRFKHRKRFRKVRIPAAVTLKKIRTLGPDFGKQDFVQHETNNVDTNQLFPKNNNRPTGSIIIKKPTSTTTIPTTTVQPPPSTTTIPLTVDNGPKRKPGKYRNILLNNLQINNENNDKDINDSGSSRDINRAAVSTDSVDPLEMNSKVNLNETNIPLANGSEFKIFCTFDALRSMPLTAGAENEARYFNMEALEQNSAILKHCTHLVYAFANVDLNGDLYVGLSSIHQDLNLRTKNKELNEANLVRLQRIKQQYPHLKLLLAVGGWDTPPQLFSLMVATDRLRDRLAINIQKFILEYGFNGAIIAWFYPVYGTRSTLDFRSIRAAGQTLFQVDDKQNLFRFVRSLKTRFQSFDNGGNNNGINGLEIGLMIPPFEEFIDRGYDAQNLSQFVDHLILMTYDYYGSWDNQAHHFAPLYSKNGSNDERNIKFNIDYTVNYWINEKQAPRNQTIIGVAFYGRSFTLANDSDAQAGSPAIGPGLPGPVTNRPGLLAFNELCELYLGNPSVRLIEDEYRITANLQLYNQWVGFDDELSLYLKTKYAIGNKLSGLFIWSINYDDYRNRCGWGSFPLLKAVNKAVEHCTIWKQCGELAVSRQNITANLGPTLLTIK